ncbi:type I-A CRISPR-associated protein Cas5 [Candidatus Korarchaeum cryptofilum]|uniref:Type I-A CRISPR-associated protein Cas5 n=2 Tax=Candidatus Korarchaeum cryptofilum TaxID=498846 RepID=A0A3R9RJQ9_9CREN|nr:type I-A CRISPR-associated protein Cas5 [Candidatus Korarchaeum cryptofilum]
MMNTSAFIVDVEFVWGFQTRIAGLSKTSPSFYYPPPTTFLGALGESIARKLGVGESAGRGIIASLGRELLALGIRPLNCVPLKYEDINKIIAVKLTSGIPYPDPRSIASSYDSPARGKTVMVSLDENSPILRFLLVFRKDKIDLRGKALELDEDYFWRIHRLGSKESRVSVIDVRRKDGIDAEEGKIISKYSFPVMKGVQPLEELQRKWLYETYISPRDIEYSERANPVLTYMESRSLIPFRIPILVVRTEEPEFIVEVREPSAYYRVDGEVVIGWRG